MCASKRQERGTLVTARPGGADKGQIVCIKPRAHMTNTKKRRTQRRNGSGDSQGGGWSGSGLGQQKGRGDRDSETKHIGKIVKSARKEKNTEKNKGGTGKNQTKNPFPTEGNQKLLTVSSNTSGGNPDRCPSDHVGWVKKENLNPG